MRTEKMDLNTLATSEKVNCAGLFRSTKITALVVIPAVRFVQSMPSRVGWVLFTTFAKMPAYLVVNA